MNYFVVFTNIGRELQDEEIELPRVPAEKQLGDHSAEATDVIPL